MWPGLASRIYHIEGRGGPHCGYWPPVLFSGIHSQVREEAYKVQANIPRWLLTRQQRDLLSRPTPLFQRMPTVTEIIPATSSTSILVMFSITLMALSRTSIMVSIIVVVVTTKRIVIVGIFWSGCIVQLLFITGYRVLDGCDVDANLEFPVSRVFARGRLDEV